MEDDAQRLMVENLSKNMSDQDEYPAVSSRRPIAKGPVNW